MFGKIEMTPKRCHLSSVRAAVKHTPIMIFSMSKKEHSCCGVPQLEESGASYARIRRHAGTILRMNLSGQHLV